VKGREAVVREGIRPCSIFGEDAPQRVEPSEGRGFEDRELVIGRKQLSGLLDVPCVQGLHRLAHRY
jgi:hypothetical protein